MRNLENLCYTRSDQVPVYDQDQKNGLSVIAWTRSLTEVI